MIKSKIYVTSTIIIIIISALNYYDLMKQVVCDSL